jgi:DNA-binding FadR family transcriptional regulator
MELRRTQTVLDIFKTLVAEGIGADGLRAGDICTRLRELGQPMETWQVRGALSTLEADGAIVVDPRTGAWFLAEPTDTEAPLKDTA